MEGSGKLQQFTSHSMFSILVQFMHLGIGFAISVLTARWLGPEGRGQLSLVLLIPFIGMTLGRLGVTHGLNYYGARVPARNIISGAVVLGFILGSITLLVLFPGIWFLRERFFSGITPAVLLMMAACIPVFTFYINAQGALQGIYQIRKMNLLMLVHPFLYLSLLGLFLLGLERGVGGAALAYCLALVLTGCVAIVFLSGEVSIREWRSGFDLGFIRKLIRFGLRSHLGNLLKDLSYRGDLLLVALFLPGTAVGQYAIAVAMAEVLLRIPNGIGVVLLPRISHLDKEAAARLTPRVCRVTFGIVALCALVFFPLNEPFIRVVFGDDYLPSASALRFLLPGVIVISVWKILANDLIARGFPGRYSISSAVSFAVMVGLDLLLIPKWGIRGAAIASSFAYLVAAVILVTFYCKTSSNGIFSLFVLRWSDLSFFRRKASTTD